MPKTKTSGGPITMERRRDTAEEVAARKSTRKSAAATGDAREKIIVVAEELFAKHGFDAVGLRDITAAAQVNLAMVNYYFGSKKDLLAEVVTRHAKEVVRARLDLLSQVARDRQGRPKLEDIIVAFARPAFEMALFPSGAAYLRIRARLAIEPEGVAKVHFDETYDASHHAFIKALGEALPNLSREEVYWGFHCVMGLVVYTTAHSGRIEGLSRGICDTTDIERSLAHVIPFVVQGFRALERKHAKTLQIKAKPNRKERERSSR